MLAKQMLWAHKAGIINDFGATKAAGPHEVKSQREGKHRQVVQYSVHFLLKLFVNIQVVLVQSNQQT